MSFEDEKKKFGRERIEIIELDLDFCANTAGVLPCTATETGDDKCYNCQSTCNDLDNYDPSEVKTIRIFTDLSPNPIGISKDLDLSAIPCISGPINISPSVAEVGGGLGTRSSLVASANDFPHSDIGFDPYYDERTYDPFEMGTFWTKLIARFPNYENRPARHKIGFLVDGTYDENNFTTSHYIIDKITAGNGAASVRLKDPLKLAMMKKAKVPKPSSGVIANAGGISAAATSVTIELPAGVDVDEEYGEEGFVLIDDEIIEFTRSAASLVMDITGGRGSYNTDAAPHNKDATIQYCYYKNDQVNKIVEDIAVNFCNINPAYIPSSSWQAEIDTYMSGLLDGIIPKPQDAFKELKQLGLEAPHFLQWDPRSQEIKLTVLKAPPETTDVLDMDANFIKNSVQFNDHPEMRLSSVFVQYGQINPVKSLNEGGNFEVTYQRTDTDSLDIYDNVDQIQTIKCRWINAQNNGQARVLAALIGRRFANTPKKATFSLDIKDSDVWLGQNWTLDHRDLVFPSGAPKPTIFQITSVAEGKNYNYSALEFGYGGELPEDEGGGDPNVRLILIGANEDNLNLRDRYDLLFPAPDASTIAKFVVDDGVIVGSISTLTESINTGSWPAGATVILQTNLGSFVVGAGGRGGGDSLGAPTNGGLAILMNHDLEIVNNGVIGGGGGAGGRAETSSGGNTGKAGGGGGAGSNNGPAGVPTSVSAEPITVIPASAGSTDNGGAGGVARFRGVAGEPFQATGGVGGDLGQDGGDGDTDGNGGTEESGAVAGAAINRNGYTLTQTVAGDIRGAILA